MRYLIDEVLELPRQWAQLGPLGELDMDTASQVLEEAGRFAAEVLAPTNAPGDLEGCHWTPDGVRTPSGFRQAYQAFVAAGWPSLACAPDVGGQGLPQVLNAALFEMLVSANHAWTMYPGLLHGAYDALLAHASADLKSRYLDPIVSGRWLATMCLTEAQAGSDLGLIKTRAEPAGGPAHGPADGPAGGPAGEPAYRLRGSKIFISGGDHDLTDNIVHLVLARLSDAPPGTKGISLFLCPKFLPDGTRNAVRCDGLERKMGIKGSATCVMNFDGALGWLIGEPHRGLAAMFPMMNSARLHVAIQGLAHAETASQNALRYAQERLQSRGAPGPLGAPGAPGAPGAAPPPGAAVPIVQHPAMRRSLLRQRVMVEGSRLVAYEAAHLLDVAQHAADRPARDQAHDDVSMLTPILKAFLTANGFQIASEALQIFGGHGYVHDWGVEQCVRDSRIALIYEGTNEIQAIDLLVRKVLPDGAAKFQALLQRVAHRLPGGGAHSAAAMQALRQLGAVSGELVTTASSDPELAYRVADDFLRAAGHALILAAWARCDAVSAAPRSGGGAFHRAKCELARHCFDYVLPEFEHALRMVAAGHSALGHLPAAA